MLETAVAIADQEGLVAVTMRRVAQGLGVEAMSLYRHVANKDDLLDGLIETVVHEINAACEAFAGESQPTKWRPALRRQILAARSIIVRHPWAPALISARGTFGGEFLTYFERLSATMAAGGCSIDLVHHAMHVLGSRALGFSPELFHFSAAAPPDPDMLSQAITALAEQFPTLSRVITTLAHDADAAIGWCDDQFEFELGLDIILDGLEARQRAESAPPA